MSDRDLFILNHRADFEKFLEEFISLKSISATGEGIEETVEFLQSLLQDLLGAKVEIIKTEGNPIILASLKGKKSKNVLFYGHYDVMNPGDLSKWSSDPFKLTKSENRFFSRGVGDNKGQLMAQILGLYTYRCIHKEFPFDITLLIEGEEEQGSKNLRPTLKHIASTELSDIDMAVVVDGSFSADGTHVLRMGNRGLFAFELICETGSRDNHSGNLGNVMDNPFVQLLKYLDKIYDYKTGKVKLEHFYNGVEKPNVQEQSWINDLPYDKEKIQKQSGIKRLPLDKEAYYQNLMFKPTFNFLSVKSGYMDKGIKTIIPHQASIKVDCRLVGNQSISEIKNDLETVYCKELADGSLKLEYLGAIPPEHTIADKKQIAWISKAIQQGSGGVHIEPIMPGTVPNYVWKDILKVPVFTVPYANYDQHNHDINENLTQKAFFDGVRISYELLNQG
ncbi:M20/M25/M40 family metallo-hydrolase [Companilactobacillus halodurans]|uniref:M20/M25/M40 family metallo-hydrolase n=1 Tax=Companilactobacillus halodurans TaxID=2584183 RepID=A0A5P0ZNN6_9LACO|nr:M20/M25/M40 family metallo-hydrolase [Companilactobacillus halodurans]MQS75451.1 M20/M25/M40 family metallo-hydrolase [Companilactobacillus halodurans]MQS97295.1 M20/M25/M40 family metallo-hydrolase [Companilactobacillus halodurans]